MVIAVRLKNKLDEVAARILRQHPATTVLTSKADLPIHADVADLTEGALTCSGDEWHTILVSKAGVDGNALFDNTTKALIALCFCCWLESPFGCCCCFLLNPWLERRHASRVAAASLQLTAANASLRGGTSTKEGQAIRHERLACSLCLCGVLFATPQNCFDAELHEFLVSEGSLCMDQNVAVTMVKVSNVTSGSSDSVTIEPTSETALSDSE